MVVILREKPEPPVMRVQRLWPDTDWVRVWHNLHEALVTDDINMIWYRAIHNICPTHARLHRINMTTSPLFRHCNTDDISNTVLQIVGRGYDVGLDKGQTCENSTNYLETDTGRMVNEAGLYPMVPQTSTGGTVAHC